MDNIVNGNGKSIENIRFTPAEQQTVAEYALLESQLRNLNRVMNGSIPPHKLKKLEKHDLPQLLIKVRNAEGKANAIMKKKGLVRK